jgi:hypothetical protein
MENIRNACNVDFRRTFSLSPERPLTGPKPVASQAEGLKKPPLKYKGPPADPMGCVGGNLLI